MQKTSSLPTPNPDVLTEKIDPILLEFDARSHIGPCSSNEPIPFLGLKNSISGHRKNVCVCVFWGGVWVTNCEDIFTIQFLGLEVKKIFLMENMFFFSGQMGIEL